MKIKNISNKPISFGSFGILPNETKDIPDSYAKNPIVDMYKKKKYISTDVKETEKKKPTAKGGDKKPPETPGQTGTDGQPDGTGNTGTGNT